MRKRADTMMVALTALGCLGTWVGALAALGLDAGIVPSAALAAISVALGVAFGWLLRGSVIIPERETAHNRLCREILVKLSELSPSDRGDWAVRKSEKDKIDGKTDFVNALESLIEQDCIRGVEVRWRLDGKANVYVGADFGVTGKRYRDD